MTMVWIFRPSAFLVSAFVGAVSIANLTAEVLRPAIPPLSLKGSTLPRPEQVASASLASKIAPFRSDLKGDYALALGEQVLGSGAAQKSANEPAARLAIENALRIGPHDSRLWLVLALVQTRNNPADPLLTEALKMSYLTGPNRPEMIPVRLRAATASNALNDVDLAELAQGDVRATLSQRPEQRLVLVDDYRRASDVGKKFLEESVKTIDPGFVDTLRSQRPIDP
jgi:hypothetical protein